jgi:tetratricopeptide (TPR) repeat protein
MRITFLGAAFAVVALFAFMPGTALARDRDKVKVSELLEEVNQVMSEAQESYVDGDGDKAVSLYRRALAEIQKIEGQHPERVTSSDFAPLRFRRALCETEIDRILLEQVSIASRSVAVTDTRDLEKKRLERRQVASTNRLAKVSENLSARTDSGIIESRTIPAPEVAAAAGAADKRGADAPAAKLDAAVELDWAADMLDAGKFEEAEKTLIKVMRAEPQNFKARYMMVLVRLRQGQFDDAEIVVEDLLADYGRNEGVLLLASGLYTAMRQYAKAMSVLDRALKLAPDRPEGYLNMAWLLLEMNPRELNDPEMYYRRSVELGGERDREMEKRLGIRQD